MNKFKLKGKTVLITGASDGVGKETARKIAKMGAHLILVGRNLEKTNRAAAEIIEDSKNEKVDTLIADLSEQSEVRKLADEIKSKYSQLDILFNNAGAAFPTRKFTSDSIEKTFASNHLAYFLLTNLLLDLLKENSKSRIINTSSSGHFKGEIDFEDLYLENGYKMMKAYRQSKLANVMFTYELAQRLKGSGVNVNALHPGFVKTNIGISEFGLLGKLLQPIIFRKGISVEEGSKTSVYLLSSEEVEGVSGKYFTKSAEKKTCDISYDKGAQKRLWEISEKLTGCFY
jgi:NAD(P)-dependent dehydrogenase (short-subunit alcohol dehydrogenase family)